MPRMSEITLRARVAATRGSATTGPSARADRFLPGSGSARSVVTATEVPVRIQQAADVESGLDDGPALGETMTQAELV